MKIVLAYSGGLDTSVIVKWLRETYDAEIVTFAADIGQEEELKGLPQKARKTGAAKHYTLDLIEALEDRAQRPHRRRMETGRTVDPTRPARRRQRSRREERRSVYSSPPLEAVRPVRPGQPKPAVGQGALAIECRADDARVRALCAVLGLEVHMGEKGPRQPSELQYDNAWRDSPVGRPLSLSLPFGIDNVRILGSAELSPLKNSITPGFRDREPGTIERFHRMVASISPDGYVGCCAALRDADLRDDVGRLDVPVLTIAGAQDVATPPDGVEFIHAGVPGSSSAQPTGVGSKASRPSFSNSSFAFSQASSAASTERRPAKGSASPMRMRPPKVNERLTDAEMNALSPDALQRAQQAGARTVVVVFLDIAKLADQAIVLADAPFDHQLALLDAFATPLGVAPRGGLGDA